jgi:hypothetical protein
MVTGAHGVSDPVRVRQAERDAVFDEVLDEALTKNREVEKGLRHQDTPSGEDLRAAARAQRALLLGEARRQEEEYRQASIKVRARRRRRRAEEAAGISGAVALIVLLAGYAAATYWNAELKNAYGAAPHSHLSVWAVVGRGLGDAAFLGGIAWWLGAMVVAAILGVGSLLSKWRSGKSQSPSGPFAPAPYRSAALERSGRSTGPSGRGSSTGPSRRRRRSRQKAEGIASIAVPVVIAGIWISSSAGGVVAPGNADHEWKRRMAALIQSNPRQATESGPHALFRAAAYPEAIAAAASGFAGVSRPR